MSQFRIIIQSRKKMKNVYTDTLLKLSVYTDHCVKEKFFTYTNSHLH